jgi:hypothetical protein
MGAAELLILWFYWTGETVVLTPAASDILGRTGRVNILGRT